MRCKKFGAEYAYGDVTEIINGEEYKTIISGKKQYKTRAVIISSGAEYKKVGVPGETEHCRCCGTVAKQRDSRVIRVGR